MMKCASPVYRFSVLKCASPVYRFTVLKRASPLYCAKANDWIKGIGSLALSRFSVVKKMLTTLLYANSARHSHWRADD